MRADPRHAAGCCLLIAALTLTACAPRPRGSFDGAHRAALSDSVRTMLNDWTAAIATRDADRVARFYSDSIDFRWIEDGQVRYASRGELVSAIRAFAAPLRALTVTLTEPEITPLRPGLATVVTAFAQKMTDSTGAVSGVAGAISGVVVHGDSGWAFLQGHGSLLPPPVPDSTRGARRS